MNLKKITLGMIALTLAGNYATAQIKSAAPYCDPGFSEQYNMLDNLTIKGTKFSFGKMGSFGETNTYLYYNTASFPDLKRGEASSFELNVYSVNDVEPIYFAIWIDYNKNNTFDAAELVMQNSNTIKKKLPTFGEAVAPIKLDITVPATASLGKTRMRVMRGTNDADPYAAYSATFMLNACHTTAGFSYGCVYDFDVNIVSATSSLEEKIVKDQVLFTPNPASNGRIQLGAAYLGADLRITDIGGKLVLQQEKVNNGTVDISALRPGVYFVSMLKEGQSYLQTLQVD